MPRYSRVAQLVEQVAVNHPVGGSSPSPGAFTFEPLSPTFPGECSYQYGGHQGELSSKQVLQFNFDFANLLAVRARNLTGAFCAFLILSTPAFGSEKPIEKIRNCANSIARASGCKEIPANPPRYYGGRPGPTFRCQVDPGTTGMPAFVGSGSSECDAKTDIWIKACEKGLSPSEITRFHLACGVEPAVPIY